MDLFEPAPVATLCSTLQIIVREALDIVIENGVPAETTKEFLPGHLNILLSVIHDQIPGVVFSVAANKTILEAKHY